jgi:hypothetical protein
MRRRLNGLPSECVPANEVLFLASLAEASVMPGDLWTSTSIYVGYSTGTEKKPRSVRGKWE